ncbi:MAG: transcription antitermination factor NusB [Deltaproteobacteria bacterium]|nr:MAG: transcription antitermination factor NusB [Deltaproteobacteria bacterium]
MGVRRKARELAIQVLFSLDFGVHNPEQAFELICRNFDANKKVKDFSKELVLGVWKNREEIDKVINSVSKNWRLERMSRVDKSILRLATYELLFRDDIPPKVSINEAIELGKKFSDETSYTFINGILDSIYNLFVKKGDDHETEKIHSS